MARGEQQLLHRFRVDRVLGTAERNDQKTLRRDSFLDF